MIVIVGSRNPVKINAVQNAFEKTFPEIKITVQGHPVESGVADQPMSDAETLKGALNRSDNCKNTVPGADFWVGIEGGCQFQGHDLEAFAWMVVKSNTLLGKARTSTFVLPPPVAELVKAGMELGDADDKVFQKENSKQQNGAVGILTKDVINRASYYEQAMILALIPFVNEVLYRSK